jgi:protein-disulfide isomerase
MHDLLFANQSRLKAHQLSSYAERLRLDMVHYSADIKDHVYLQRIREHQQGGSESGVRSTPAFFVNRILHDVSFGLTGLFEAVEIVLGSSRLRKRG